MFKSVKILVLSLTIMLVALPAVMAAEQPTGALVTVTGQYQEEIAPDIAFINLGTVTESENITNAQAKNAAISAQVRGQLEALGIKPDSIKTANYSVTPLYRNDDNGRHTPAIKGYQVSNSITVTVAPDKAGEVVDTALAAGANQVNSVRFGKYDEAEAKNTALVQAVRDAMSKAEAVASVLHKRVVKVKSVNENGVYLQNAEVSNRLYSKAVQTDVMPATPISPGLVQLSANVQIVVELE